MEDVAIDILIPVMEAATILAAHYTKACERDVVMAEDMSLGLMYAARHVTGKQIGTMFPEIWDESVSDDEEDVEDDSEIVWTRYQGNDDISQKMNECMETWDSWEPDSPAEIVLKNAVDKSSVFSRGG
jgi:hypothetical protein